MYEHTYFKPNYIEFDSRYLWKIEQRELSEGGFLSGIRINIKSYADYKIEGKKIWYKLLILLKLK